jgi:nitrous oxide reductase accessory protein NosL
MRTLIAVALSVATLLLPASVALADHHLGDVKEGFACKYCGMDRQKFASSRMVVEFDDGTMLHACSLHCTAVDLALQIDRTPIAIKVADLNTQVLVDAEKAVWVLGGTRAGVMTKRGKWAFAGKGAAAAFAKENGGAIVSFDDAMKAAYEDMYQDTKMIRERRKAKRAAGQPVPVPVPGAGASDASQAPAAAAQPAARAN